MSLNIYTPADISMVLGGVITVEGYIDGTFLTITKDIAPYRSKRTPDGTTARLYIKDNNYTVKFSLAQTSKSNDLLGRIQKIDEATQLASFPFLIRDHGGNTVFFSPTAWIEGIPEQTFGKGIEGRTWEIKATQVLSVIGGNDSPQDLFSKLTGIALAAIPVLDSVLGE